MDKVPFYFTINGNDKIGDYMDYTMLVNKENMLDNDFVPKKLIEYNDYNGEKLDINHKTMLEEETMKAFFEMKKAVNQLGYDITIDSGYRSYYYQREILEDRITKCGQDAYNYVALPGASEHQTGLALDVALIRNGIYTEEFDDSFPEIKWLHDNCHKYGFILRYPKGKEKITGFNYECWHFRYVGKDLSEEMHDKNIQTLEGYSLSLNNKYIGLHI